MDRLGEIRTKNCAFLTYGEKDWLISEIEQLRKEKEWLLTGFAQIYKDTYSGIDESIDDIKKNACLQMDKELNQVLKEQ